jgi:integrase
MACEKAHGIAGRSRTMTVRIRPYNKGKSTGWEVDVRFRWPDGTEHRERTKARVTSKSAARRWGEDRERELLLQGKPAPGLEPPLICHTPTLREFHPRFIEEHCLAERHKPSGIERKQSAFRVHLLPLLGERLLDQITLEDVQRLKVRLAGKRPKTVNNVLTVLNKTLGVAVDWGVISAIPCRIKLLRNVAEPARWYEPHEYARLVDAAAEVDQRVEVLIRLGGDAGLRRGEMIGLRQCDVDFARRVLTVRKSVWNHHETAPKSGKPREVPLTQGLFDALRAVRHLRGPRVLYADSGEELTAKVVRRWLEKAQRRAGLEVNGAIHQLRHTFCSLLAMKGAPAKAIQELAGHADLTTTMRYMHLSPAARDSAIRLLDQPFQESHAAGRGEILETAVK